MSLAIGDEHELLADAVQRFAAQRCTPAVARVAADGDPAQLPPFWDELDALGWLTRSPADGLGFSELAIVLEGLGQSASLDASTFLYAFATVAGGAMPGGLGVADG